MGKDFHLHGLDSRQGEPPTSSSRSAAESNLPVDVQLELERLRAERDAMAAELQIERAERLHVEERLRLLEREKLEQMRLGAASREKLASELEEARLRAMRSEARQAALEADTRLAELESRRRAPWAAGDSIGPLAGEIAEPPAEEPAAADAPEDEQPSEAPAAPGSSRAMPSAAPGGTDQRWSRGRSASSAATERAEARARLRDRDRTGGRAASAGASRRPASGDDQQLLNTSRLRGPATAPRPPADARGPGARTGPPGGERAGGSAPAGRRSGDAGAKAGPPGAASGGAAAGRPSIDRAQLEARLAAGAAIRTTDRFRQFQPIAQSHIRVCDWLGEATTLAEIEKLSAGQVAPAEILNVLVLFLERSFLVIDG